MPLDDFKKRYLHISKAIVQVLKDNGFKKTGSTYSKEHGDLILQLAPRLTRPWINSDSRYEFEVSWELMTATKSFIELYMFMEGEKNLAMAPLLYSTIIPEAYKGGVLHLHNDDPSGFDEQIITGIKEKIAKEVIPWFENLGSMDDIIQLAETECDLEREKRKFFRHTNIYRNICDFYAANGWKDKALAMCDRYVANTPVTARRLAEKRKSKYLNYFEKFWDM